MSQDDHILRHFADVFAVGVAWLSVTFTLAGVQSVTTIFASVLSALYLVARLAGDPTVKEWTAKLRSKNKSP